MVQTSANITRLFAGINLNRKLSFYISFLDFSVTSACLHDQQNRTGASFTKKNRTISLKMSVRSFLRSAYVGFTKTS